MATYVILAAIVAMVFCIGWSFYDLKKNKVYIYVDNFVDGEGRAICIALAKNGREKGERRNFMVSRTGRWSDRPELMAEMMGLLQELDQQYVVFGGNTTVYVTGGTSFLPRDHFRVRELSQVERPVEDIKRIGRYYIGDRDVQHVGFASMLHERGPVLQIARYAKNIGLLIPRVWIPRQSRKATA